MQNDDELLKRLRKLFRGEAEEHIRVIALGLVDLEKADAGIARREVLDTVFRAAHSLKGAARSINAGEIESLCQSVENVFAALQEEKLELSGQIFDVLHAVVRDLPQLLEGIDGVSTGVERRGQALVDMLEGLLEWQQPLRNRPLYGTSSPAVKEPVVAGREQQDRSVSDTKPLTTAVERGTGTQVQAPASLRVDAGKLDSVLLQTEEMLAVKQAALLQAEKLRHFRNRYSDFNRKWKRISHGLRTMERVVNGNEERVGEASDAGQLAGVLKFLNWGSSYAETLATDLDELMGLADREKRSVGARVDSLHEEMTLMAMQPCSTLLDVLPLFVRDTARRQGKDVELKTRGGEVEFDRRILEAMKDPLNHLVRNCLDHGLELPEERVKKCKPRTGTIKIVVAAKDGNRVELSISDDGRGIDTGRLRDRVVTSSLLTREEAETIEDGDLLSFIFKSGVSTSPMITDMSGRGLGLAIVRDKVEEVNGRIEVDSKPGQGVQFIITLPLTLARFRGVVVRSGGTRYVIPVAQVERVAGVNTEQIQTVENRDTLALNGDTLSVLHLDSVLGVQVNDKNIPNRSALNAVILHAGGKRIALMVDEVCEELEVKTRSFGSQLVYVKNFAGAVILEDGDLLPLLNVKDLVTEAAASAAIRVSTARTDNAAEAEEMKSILVAEDSLTTRALLKNILETAGYRVETAVDGVEAYTLLRNSDFDLLLSDVDMPRLNGFGLTAKVRQDHNLGELPVILVTSLESPRDREHGINAGANAYLVKSGFDQSSLLETIRRLI